jgi:hypothetical protein
VHRLKHAATSATVKYYTIVAGTAATAVTTVATTVTTTSMDLGDSCSSISITAPPVVRVQTRRDRCCRPQCTPATPIPIPPTTSATCTSASSSSRFTRHRRSRSVGWHKHPFWINRSDRRTLPSEHGVAGVAAAAAVAGVAAAAAAATAAASATAAAASTHTRRRTSLKALLGRWLPKTRPLVEHVLG